MMVVWLILNMQFCTARRIYPSVKKFVNYKIFVLIKSTIKPVEWLCIDSGVLKFKEKIANHLLGVTTQCLSPQLKIGTFPHYVGQRVDFRQDH